MSVGDRLIQPDVHQEAVRLLAAAEASDLCVRALGGIGIALHVGEQMHPAFRRKIGDIDLATPKRDGRKVADFLAVQGYEPNKTFNAMHGARRLLFYDEPNDRQIDVFVGTFEMCHQLPLQERLKVDRPTLPLADLVLTKLQIVKLNRKDAYDLYSLFLSHPVEGHDDDAINSEWIAGLCARDWGLYRTIEINLEWLTTGVEVPELSAEEMATIRERLNALADAVQQAPKSGKWRMRARVGDRMRWYEDPEEVDKGAY